MDRSSDGERRPLDEQAALRAVVQGTATTTGEEFFAALVRKLAEALEVHGAWITEYSEDERRLRSRAFWLANDYVDEYEYALAGTPCEDVIQDRKLVHVPERVVELFPGDPDLPKLAAVSYMGVPLLDQNGRILGNLAVLDTRPMPNDPRLFDLIRIFANRAVAELRRIETAAELQRRERKLNLLVDSAMDAIVELDSELVVTRCNAAAIQAFGCRESPMEGCGIETWLEPTGRRRFRESLERLRDPNGGEPYLWIAGGLDAKQSDGARFAAEATISRYRMGDEEFLTLILRNVDDRLAAERQIHKLEEQTAYLHQEIKELRQFDRIVGSSPALLAAMSEVTQVSATDATVLLIGETGTGKELFARAIHDGSHRKRGPMVILNCAAIPTDLMESELFGHERGAFTGATQRREGRFAMADSGTLFLDEIGELPLELQGKLLRVLQEGEFEPVGSSLTRKSNVRLIAATNRDLPSEVRSGRFREDLFYRLNVFPIVLPPLRERGRDVLELASEFAENFSRNLGRTPKQLDEASERSLLAYRWPGNVRELRNVLERAVITSQGRFLSVDTGSLQAAAEPSGSTPKPADEPAERILTDAEIRELERENIVRALAACGGRVSGESGAARRLGIKPSTLTSRMKAFGIR